MFGSWFQYAAASWENLRLPICVRLFGMIRPIFAALLVLWLCNEWERTNISDRYNGDCSLRAWYTILHLWNFHLSSMCTQCSITDEPVGQLPQCINVECLFYKCVQFCAGVANVCFKANQSTWSDWKLYQHYEIMRQTVRNLLWRHALMRNPDQPLALALTLNLPWSILIIWYASHPNTHSLKSQII